MLSCSISTPEQPSSCYSHRGGSGYRRCGLHCRRGVAGDHRGLLHLQEEDKGRETQTFGGPRERGQRQQEEEEHVRPACETKKNAILSIQLAT